MVKTILTPTQKNLLEEFFLDKNIANLFYLTGGTALAEYYLKHRYSEDLDLFSQEEFDPLDIQITLKKIKNRLKIKKIDYQKSFNRNLFFLYFDKEIIKTEFTYYPFEQIEKPKKKGNIKIDSLIDIAVNKIFTIYQKPKSRDFIDLYLIIKRKKLKINNLRRKARIKFDTPIDPLQLAQQLMEVKNLKDFPKMITPLKEEVWQDFWIKQAMLLKSEVLE
jgi:predicted nucleotidyltransferase component of viral defense system